MRAISEHGNLARDMGSSVSRGKKVAPECESEMNASTGVTSPKHSAPFRPLKIPTLLRSARNRAHQDGHSEDSERSVEEEDTEQDVAKKASVKKTTTVRSRTYGLCHFNSEDTDEDMGSYHQGRASTELCGGQDINTKGYTRAVLFPRRNRVSTVCLLK